LGATKGLWAALKGGAKGFESGNRERKEVSDTGKDKVVE